MLFPAPFERALTKSHFWRKYAIPTDMAPGNYDELVGLKLDIRTPDGYGLALRFEEPRPRPHLDLITGDGRIEIASPDAEHVLRHDELEAFARYAALAHGHAHPGAIVGLLSRFTPIVDKDAPVRVHVVHRAFTRVPMLEHDSPTLWAYTDYRGAQFAWSREDDHWILDQPKGVGENMDTWPARHPVLASTRVNRGFPHAQLAEAVHSADRASKELVRPWQTPATLALAQRIADGDQTAIAALSDALEGTIAKSATPLDASWIVELLLGQPADSVAARLPLGPEPRESPVDWHIWLSNDTGLLERIGAAGLRAIKHDGDILRIKGLRGPLQPIVERLLTAFRTAGLQGRSFCVGNGRDAPWYKI